MSSVIRSQNGPAYLSMYGGRAGAEQPGSSNQGPEEVGGLRIMRQEDGRQVAAISSVANNGSNGPHELTIRTGDASVRLAGDGMHVSGNLRVGGEVAVSTLTSASTKLLVRSAGEPDQQGQQQLALRFDASFPERAAFKDLDVSNRMVFRRVIEGPPPELATGGVERTSFVPSETLREGGTSTGLSSLGAVGYETGRCVVDKGNRTVSAYFRTTASIAATTTGAAVEFTFGAPYARAAHDNEFPMVAYRASSGEGGRTPFPGACFGTVSSSNVTVRLMRHDNDGEITGDWSVSGTIFYEYF